MLHTYLADLTPTVALTTPPETSRGRSIYQVVQESAAGTHLFTSFDRLEDAMKDAAERNAETGGAYKTVMWGTNLPVQRVDPRKLNYRGDNILPGYVLHPAAVASHPDVLPVAAIYKRGTQVLFLPTGEAVLAGLDVYQVGRGRAVAPGVTFPQALVAARSSAVRRGDTEYVSVRRRGRVEPVMAVHPKSRARGTLSGLSETDPAVVVVTPVTPEEYRAMTR